MGGRAAVRGFEYQFLCTLSSALDALRSPDFTGVHVEAISPREPGGDAEIVDFALVDDQVCTLAAQVKSSTTGRPLSAAEALEILLRLVTNAASRYLLITNRPPASGLGTLSETLADFSAGRCDVGDLRPRLADVVTKSPVARQALAATDDAHLRRLAGAAIVVDGRSVTELYEVVRERVRDARHGLAPDSVGWDAAGLLTGYLMSELLNRAGVADSASFTRDDLVAALCMETTVLASVMRTRDWSVHVNPAPRETDVARPGLLDRIAEALPTPPRDDAVPVCVLTGLSGIGKTSTAVAWCNDRADAYAVVIWVEAATTGQLQTSFTNAAAWFGLQTAPGGDQSVRAGLFAALAASARPWLMVFDNAVNFRQLHEWLPPRGRGHVLVTTVDPTSIRGANVASIQVGSMSEGEAVDLLVRRLAPGRTPTGDELAAAGSLAAQLQHWPLALELAAAYLDDCLGGFAGIGTYRTMMLRALSDEASVPVGYPRPLVQAIVLAWQRMRDGTAQAEEFASMALRHAAFLAPRQIPLHLAIACFLIGAAEVGEFEQDSELPIYRGDEPPAGEIVRALRRQSLVSVDAPLSDLDDESSTPGSPAYTVTVNEIVQLILRDEVVREGGAHAIITATALQVQHWISVFWATEHTALAMTLAGHAVAAIEHAEELGVEGEAVALLLGNAANILLHHNHAAEAARYLTAELAMVDRFEAPDALLRLQVCASLAAAVFDSTDRPSEVANEFVRALHGCLLDVDTARDTDEYKTAHTLRMALATALNALNNGMADERVATIRSVIEQYCDMIPLGQSIDFVSEMNTLNALIGEQRYDDALARINQLLSSPELPTLVHPQLQRMGAECLLWLGDWHNATLLAEHFVEAARQDRIRTIDAANFSRNVGIAALTKLAEARQEAIAMLRSAIAVADHHARNNHQMQVQDRAVIGVYRAFMAFLDGDAAACQDHLDMVNAHDLRIADHFQRNVHRALGRWITSRTAQVPMADGAAATLANLTVSALCNPVPDIGPEESIFVLHQGLALLGLAPRLIPIRLTVTSTLDGRTMGRSTTLHQVVWIESCGMLVDPTVPFEPQFMDVEDIRSHGAVMVHLRHHDQLTMGATVLRGAYALTYDHPDETAPNPQDLVAEERKPVVNAVALLLAFRTLLGAENGLSGEPSTPRPRRRSVPGT